MLEPRFLRACRGHPVDRTPVWFMRQAGRYLPEYRAIRERHDFLTMARTPELAAEVTLQPVRRLGVDAAILFADILLPFPAMGVPLRFSEGEGPVIDTPIRSRADVERLRIPDPGELSFVAEAIRLVRRDLPSDVALIGFAGAPFTLGSYLVEGGHSTSFERTKALLWNDPPTWSLLLGKMAATCAAYLRMQIEAGAQAVQLFDSWVGCLAPADYETAVLPHTKQIFDALRPLGVPTLHFGTDTGTLLPLLAKAGGDVLGVDWRLPLTDARRMLGTKTPLQGNLDPVALLASPEAALAAARRVLREGRGGPHIFNTGHGLLPPTPPDLVRRLVELCHEEGPADIA